MNNAHKEILDNFFGMILEDSINDNMMEFSYRFPYDGMKEYALEICAVPFSVFLEYINRYQDIDEISADCVSQFSKLDDCLLGFCEATDNMRRPLTFEEIGERLQDDGVDRNSVANIKYGENHAKMALQFGLAQCRYNYWYISALGKVFSKLSKEKQDALMIRTLLRNKLYALIFTRLQTQDVSIENILKKVSISESTRTRRISSVKKILTWFFAVLSSEEFRYHYKVIECPLLNRQNENLPINYIRRSLIVIPKQRKDLRYFVSLSASEKDFHTYSDLYLEQILRIPYLTKEDEQRYFERYLAGDERAKDAIIESYLPTIYNIAKRYVIRFPNIDIQDLIGEGVYALCKAIPYYNPSSPARIITYAMHEIRKNMYEHILQNHQVYLPVNQDISLYNFNKSIQRFEVEHGYEPNIEDLTKILNISIDKVTKLRTINNLKKISSIEWDNVEDSKPTNSPLYNLQNESLRLELNNILTEQLTQREAHILRASFGIGESEKSYEEIGIQIHLTRERLRQLKERAVYKIKICPQVNTLKTYLGDVPFYQIEPCSESIHKLNKKNKNRKSKNNTKTQNKTKHN